MRYLVVAACLLTVGCAADSGPVSVQDAQPSSTPEFVNLVDPWPYPFSSAVRTGNMLFLSGQIGTRVENGAPTLVAGGIDAEARQTLDNIREVLEYAGTSMDRVVKCSVMMADMSEWPRLNEIYETYFPGPKPARSAWGATGLALGARVEIECIAAID